MTYDITQLSINQTATMPVCDAAGEPQFDSAGNPLSITLYGPGSKQYQKAKHAAEQRNQARVMANMQGRAGENKLTAEEKSIEDAEFLAACTASFNNFGRGELTGYELYKAVYADIEIGHIAEDAGKYIAKRANFLKRPVKP